MLDGVELGDGIFVKLGVVGGVLSRLGVGVGGVLCQVFGGGAGGVVLAEGAILSSVIDDAVLSDIMF